VHDGRQFFSKKYSAASITSQTKRGKFPLPTPLSLITSLLSLISYLLSDPHYEKSKEKGIPSQKHYHQQDLAFESMDDFNHRTSFVIRFAKSIE
jgi:hypothetical protein